MAARQGAIDCRLIVSTRNREADIEGNMLMANVEKVFRDAGLLVPDRQIGYREPRVWVALLSSPSKERDAADWLRRAHVPAYWPNFTKQVAVGVGQRNGRRLRRAVQCAVIPGYIFIAVGPDVAEPWDVVHATPGIHGFVRDALGRPAIVTERDIEKLRKLEGDLNLPPPTKAVHSFKCGQKVRFIAELVGAWPVGKIARLADDGRIVVEIPLLGRTVPITAYPHQIEAMQANAGA